jgi:hypothetical protein
MASCRESAPQDFAMPEDDLQREEKQWTGKKKEEKERKNFFGAQGRG